MGDVFEGIGSIFGDVIEVLDPIAEVVGPVLTAAGFPEFGIPITVASSFVETEAEREEGRRPSPPGPSPRDFLIPGAILAEAFLRPEPEVTVQAGPTQITLDFAPLQGAFAELLTEQTSLLTNILPSVINPLLQEVNQQNLLLADLRNLGFSAFLPLAEDFIGVGRSTRDILIPGVSTASLALFQIIRAILTGQDVPPESILQIFREAMVFVGRTAGPEVKQWLPHVNRMLSLVLPEVLGKKTRVLTFLDPEADEDELTTAMGLTPVQAAAAKGLLGLKGLFKWLLAGAGMIFAEQGYRTLEDALPALSGAAAKVGETVATHYFTSLELLAGPMQAVIRTAAPVLFGELQGKLDSLAEATPENVFANASELLAVAGGLGISAHITAQLAEKLTIFKQAGFPQMAAFLVDLAGFRDIARHSIGVQIETALRAPARRLAQRRFRPDWPDARSMEQLFLERQITEATYRRYLEEQGWSDELIESQLVAVFREARPTDLALVFEDAGSDEQWIQGQLTESGYDDRSVEEMLKGLRIRSSRSRRAELAQAVEAAFTEGAIDQRGAEGYLAVLNLRDDHLSMWLTQAGLGRLRKELVEIRQELLRSVEVGQLDLEDLDGELAARGFDERARLQAQRVAGIRRGRKVFQEERADVKAAMRRAQSNLVQSALAAHRAFALDNDQLSATLLAIGVNDTEVDSLVRLAALRREPVPRLPEALSPEALEQRVLEERGEQVLAMQRNGVLDETAAIALLMGLGFDAGRAQLEAGIVAARRLRPPEPPEEPKETAAERRARVEAEGREREAEARERQDLARQQRLLEDAARASFRRGDLDEVSLEAALLGLGLAPGVAAATVELEISRRPPPKAPGGA